VRACSVDGVVVLVIGSEAGLQVWDESGSSLLYVWSLPRSRGSTATTTRKNFVSAVSFAVASNGDVVLAAGSSHGAIYTFSVAPGPSIRPAGENRARLGCPTEKLLRGNPMHSILYCLIWYIDQLLKREYGDLCSEISMKVGPPGCHA